jgi:hypothetical protein
MKKKEEPDHLTTCNCSVPPSHRAHLCPNLFIPILHPLPPRTLYPPPYPGFSPTAHYQPTGPSHNMQLFCPSLHHAHLCPSPFIPLLHPSPPRTLCPPPYPGFSLTAHRQPTASPSPTPSPVPSYPHAVQPPRHSTGSVPIYTPARCKAQQPRAFASDMVA